MKKKYTFSTWSDTDAAYKASSRQAGALEIALGELVRGAVKWIEGEQPRKIGLCRLKDPHGGVVILVEQKVIGALFLDDWLLRVQTQPPPSTRREYMPDYRAWMDVRRLATAAKVEQDKAQDRAFSEAQGCQRAALPKEVDQNVRTY